MKDAKKDEEEEEEDETGWGRIRDDYQAPLNQIAPGGYGRTNGPMDQCTDGWNKKAPPRKVIPVEMRGRI